MPEPPDDYQPLPAEPKPHKGWDDYDLERWERVERMWPGLMEGIGKEEDQ